LSSSNEDYAKHGYGYYTSLLALRKMMGPLSKAGLTKELGRMPTNDEFLAKVQRQFGRRGFLIAQKGLQAADSTNKLTDEHLVVTAILTAIMSGKEVFIISRDNDVLEQYFKVLCLMKEHYRAMLVAERYAASHGALPFKEVPVQNDGEHVPEFSGASCLRFETTDAEFNPLPATFHFVNIYCFLLGGGPSDMKATYASFCAETEMAQMLRIKAIAGGLNSDKLNGRNCTIHTEPLMPDNHKVVVSIGKETTIPPGHAISFGFSDFNNTLFENELITHISYE
jgi:hypothetical protein